MIKQEKTVTISTKDISTLKRLVTHAMKTGEKSFKFKGREVLVSYANYMIEYLNSIKK
jgi:hypothetical protein